MRYIRIHLAFIWFSFLHLVAVFDSSRAPFVHLYSAVVSADESIAIVSWSDKLEIGRSQYARDVRVKKEWNRKFRWFFVFQFMPQPTESTLVNSQVSTLSFSIAIVRGLNGGHECCCRRSHCRAFSLSTFDCRNLWNEISHSLSRTKRNAIATLAY